MTRGDLDRRAFLKAGFAGAAAFLGVGAPGCTEGRHRGVTLARKRSNIPNLGPLQPADTNGVRLPAGFTSRIVAQSGSIPAAGGSYAWHPAPDGGAVFPASGGGWIYVSNSEIAAAGGGAGALRFDASGAVVGAYGILSGTSSNCAGGRTPWGTWLSCEESGDTGRVWECDPAGVVTASVRPALGRFNHEGTAIDPVNRHVYLTEDRTDGGLYRFLPTNPGDLSSGTLEIAGVLGGGPGGSVIWYQVTDPAGTVTATRYQIAQATPFNGGEGIAYHAGKIHFVTKGDNRVWKYVVSTATLSVVYDANTHPTPYLTGVDNVTISPDGDVLVAEDGGDMEIVAITPAGTPVRICQLVGHGASEITGPAFTPDTRRLYFSSQRGTTGLSSGGMTFEIAGPFVV